MPFNSPLGGSPLGIIGLKSWYNEKTGDASFNFGKTRNVNVLLYNKSNGGSLMSGKKRLRAWPQLQKNGDEIDSTGQQSIDYKKIQQGQAKDSYETSTLHSDTVYDTSITNIISQLANTRAALRPGDFAYLKNLGVFPNNRLIIARRFGSPVGDNIMTKNKVDEKGTTSVVGPFSTLISWMPETGDFLEMNFGEEWMDAEADFKGIITSLGEDIGISNLGGIAGAAGNALPLPGFTEIFQRQFLKKLGILEGDVDNIPAGNPNLIKVAKRRKLIGYSEAGYGLNCTVNIKMTCEYELKYISGIDPTIVWMDIISQIARFGTSNSDTYGLSGAVLAKLNKWSANPSSLLDDIVKGIKDAVEGIKDEVTKQIQKVYNLATSEINAGIKEQQESKGKKPSPYADAKKSRTANEAILTQITGLLNTVTKGLVYKYRVKLLGIANALSGNPSTPWHITIGNPLRPVFCSGDMLTTSVALKLGKQLAFNDLPSSITAEFTLTNARPWGLQEIMSKFNSGYLRTVDYQKSYFETNSKLSSDGTNVSEEPMGILPTELGIKNEPVVGGTASSNNITGVTVSNVNGNSPTSQASRATIVNPSPGQEISALAGAPKSSDLTSGFGNSNIPTSGLTVQQDSNFKINQDRVSGSEIGNQGQINSDPNSKDSLISGSNNLGADELGRLATQA